MADIISSEKDVYFETVKRISVGMIITFAAQAAFSLVDVSWKSNKLMFPSVEHLYRCLDSKTAFAVGASFGYFGLKDAIHHNQKIANARFHKSNDKSFVEQQTLDKAFKRTFKSAI